MPSRYGESTLACARSVAGKTFTRADPPRRAPVGLHIIFGNCRRSLRAVQVVRRLEVVKWTTFNSKFFVLRRICLSSWKPSIRRAEIRVLGRGVLERQHRVQIERAEAVAAIDTVTPISVRSREKL